MKKKILITAGLFFCFIVAFAYFDGISGKWAGVLSAPDGNDYPLNYTFKVDSGKLTGTGQSPSGSIDLKDGKIKGDSLSFSIDANGVTILNTGRYYSAGDSISLNVDYQGVKMHTTLKRAADK